MSNHRYQFERNKIEKMNLKLRYITHAESDVDWHSIKHTHHFTEVFFIVNGEGGFLVENERFPVKDGDLIIINPNVAHTEEGHDKGGFEYIVLGIEGMQFLSNEADLSCDYVLSNFDQNKVLILHYLNTLLREIRQKDNNYEMIIQNILEILMVQIVRKTNNAISYVATKRISKEIKQIEEYINNHFAEEISLDTLSKLTYLNKYYIIHEFKEYKGVSPINFLIARRIDEAKNLLATTDYTIAKIGELTGFSSQSYFSQIFKKETNVSPNQYRRAALKNEIDFES